jgi:ornithine cyclodeaminase
MNQLTPPASGPLWITEEDVRSCLDLNTAIAALEEGIREEAMGRATNLEKMLGVWGAANSAHALGSVMPERGYAGFKTWANTPVGATAVFSLFGADDGRLKAMMMAGLLGAFRTSGISGLATRVLASPGADEMALIGTGRQAMLQVAAIAAAVPIRRLRVFSPTSGNRARFVANAQKTFPFAVEEAVSIEDACAGMPIITLMTRASEPFLSADMVAKGAHVNAAGSVLPANAEVLPDVFERADLVVVDNLANAKRGSRELRERYGADEQNWAGIQTLGHLLVSGVGRPAGADITLFKPMGMGLSDLAMAIAVYERAQERGTGNPLPVTPIAMPRWTLAQ